MLVITRARGKLSDSLHKTTGQFNDFSNKNPALKLEMWNQIVAFTAKTVVLRGMISNS